MRSLYLFALSMLGYSIPTVALRRVDDERNEQTILLMQAERSQHDLKYMYEPPMASLRLGFESGPKKVKVVKPPVGLDYAVQLKKETALLKRGDILVWLGCSGNKLVSTVKQQSESTSKSLFMSDSSLFKFAELRARGVKIVYYQSEVMHLGEKCVMSSRDVDEMWDYSYHNIDNCKTQPDAPPQRYVPLGAHVTPVTVQQENPGALLFFGNVKWRPCWKDLQKQMGKQVEDVYNAWDDHAYERVLNTHNIYVNLHKECGSGSHWPVTWRNAKLLNSHALIISERAYSKDEQEFEGLVDFVDTHQIPERYRQLANMNATARQQIADSRAQAFSNKFDPGRIFERAGIYGNLTGL
jgi:hypothetical protein